MSDTAQDVQAREVETDSYRYLVHPDGSVTAAYLDCSPVEHEVADAVRRIAELEAFVCRYAKTGGWTGDLEDAAQLVNL